VLGDFPGLLHHERKVLVVVDARTDASVVLGELVEGDDAVLVPVRPLRALLASAAELPHAL
jgi:hypothetical protein